MVVVAARQAAQLELKCDLSSVSGGPQGGGPGAHKTLWFLEGNYLASSAAGESLKVAWPGAGDAVARRLLEEKGGRVSCSQQLLDASALAGADFHSGNSMKLLGSANELELSFGGKC